MNDTLARETTRGDELLTGGRERDDPPPKRDLAVRAYVAGYLANEVGVRRNSDLVQQIADRKAREWARRRGL